MENENNQLPMEQDNPAGPDSGMEEAKEETSVQPEESVAGAETAPAEVSAETEETVPEESQPPVQMKKGILLTPGKLVALIAGVVVLVAVLAGAIVYGMGGFKNDEAGTATDVPTTAATEETVPATTPADTGADNVTHKGTYTVSDEEIVNLADQVVATVGEETLTVQELQVYYWMQVQNFLYNYSYYLDYFGLDYTQSLDTQICNVLGNGYTWQQYFLEAALYSWHNDQAMANSAAQIGLELSEESREYMDTLADNMKNSAAEQGFATVEEMLAFNVGACSSLDAYLNYERTFWQGNHYYEQQKQAISLTDADVENYFAEHETEYAEGGITKDGTYVDVRHILIRPEGGTTDENGETTYTEEEWEACRAAAQEILDTYLAGEQTEEAFADLANTHTADGNDADQDGVPDGGLYTDVYEGQMVAEFNDWCFDENRKTGETGLVKTKFGYHVMYFVGSTPIWKSNAESDLMSERLNKIVSDACEAYPITVDYSAIALGAVDIATWFAY